MSNNEFLKGLNFDSSLSDSFDNETITEEEYIEKLKYLLEPILKKRFPDNYQKTLVKPKSKRLTFSCPYCGDSMISSHKKRGNILLSGKFKNFYKCHNCGMFKRVDQFFKDFKVDLNLDVITYISENIGDFKTSIDGMVNSSILLDVELIEGYAIERQELIKKLNLIEVEETPVSSWLKRRLQFQFERFLYNELENYLVILNLTPNKKIIGFQLRYFKVRRGEQPYKTYKISKIYELLEINKEVPEDVDVISQLFKIFEININLPITLFEGPLDAFLFKNSVANTGANKNFPLSIPLRNWFDDDDTGRKKALEHIEKGESVFLWTKFRNDFNIPWRKKWDLNDVLIYMKENNIRTPLFDNYFSDDVLDSIDL